jgi:hypothetical protein
MVCLISRSIVIVFLGFFLKIIPLLCAMDQKNRGSQEESIDLSKLAGPSNNKTLDLKEIPLTESVHHALSFQNNLQKNIPKIIFENIPSTQSLVLDTVSESARNPESSDFTSARNPYLFSTSTKPIFKI